MINPKCAALVAQLVVDTQSNIVISSSWRQRSESGLFHPSYFEKLFRIVGHPFPKGSVIGSTPLMV